MPGAEDQMMAAGARVHMALPKQEGKTALLEQRYEQLRARIEEAERADLEIPLSGNALTLCRVSKCANETGEALDALEQALGLNPRKGVCGNLDQVRKELLDVALTALAAYEHLSEKLGESGYDLLEHARTRLERIGLAQIVPPAPIPVHEEAPLTEWVEALRSEVD